MRIETLILRLKTSTKRIVLHFSKRINLIRYTFSSESNINPTKVFWFSITDFLPSNTLQRIKKHTATRRSPKRITTFVFNKRSVTSIWEYPIVQHVVSDSGHSTKWLKEGGTTRICKTMKYNDLHLSLHSVYLSKQRLYRLK